MKSNSDTWNSEQCGCSEFETMTCCNIKKRVAPAFLNLWKIAQNQRQLVNKKGGTTEKPTTGSVWNLSSWASFKVRIKGPMASYKNSVLF